MANKRERRLRKYNQLLSDQKSWLADKDPGSRAPANLLMKELVIAHRNYRQSSKRYAGTYKDKTTPAAHAAAIRAWAYGRTVKHTLDEICSLYDGATCWYFQALRKMMYHPDLTKREEERYVRKCISRGKLLGLRKKRQKLAHLPLWRRVKQGKVIVHWSRRTGKTTRYG